MLFQGYADTRALILKKVETVSCFVLGKRCERIYENDYKRSSTVLVVRSSFESLNTYCQTFVTTSIRRSWFPCKSFLLNFNGSTRLSPLAKPSARGFLWRIDNGVYSEWRGKLRHSSRADEESVAQLNCVCYAMTVSSRYDERAIHRTAFINELFPLFTLKEQK